MLKEGATIPFKTIKISCINTAYTMSCDLRKRWIVTEGQKVHNFIFFAFFLFEYTAILHGYFLISPKPFSPLLDHFRVLICIENHFG